MTLMLRDRPPVPMPHALVPGGSSPAVEVRDVSFAYAKGQPVLRDVSLTAARGGITMVLGASGGGKTTLLRLLKGLAVPQAGAVLIDGAPLKPAGRNGALDRQIASIPQQLGLVRTMSVLDNALVGALGRVGTLRSLVKLWPHSAVEQARATLDLLGIGHKTHEPVYRLSGGERQRVAIARALMQEPRLILADEFVSQLDPVTTAEIMGVMRGIADRGVALVMTTHELDVVERYADRVIVLRDGAKVLDCPGAQAGAEDLGGLIKV